MTRDSRRRAAGFTLIEIIVAVAILGILAGAVGPLVFRQLEAARAEATRRELNAIGEAIEEYHEDTGRFPADLTGLIADDGRVGWAGPYLGADWNDPVNQVSNDGFERPYTYVLNPNVIPAGSADLIVASAGLNQSLDLPSGSTWDLGDIAAVDDILVHISANRLNRDKRREALDELEVLAEAARNHYRATSGFPTALSDLSGSYLDTGFRNDALRDEWQTDYLSSIQGSGASAVLSIWSAGPDHSDDAGAGDDLLLQVNASALESESGGGGPGPGQGSETATEVATIQAAVDADPSFTYMGELNPSKINQLGLSEEYREDEWGNRYHINGDRDVFSPGPDGDPDTGDDNIPEGEGY